MNTERPPVSVLCRRALVAAALVLFPFTVAMLNKWRVAHGAVRFLVDYTPQRFVRGAVWTLPLSALITARPDHVSVAVGVMMLLMAPYLILAGFPRTIARFFAGHVGCTLVVLVVIVVTSATGWATATKLYSTSDMGVSAGAAAIGGAFVILLWRTRMRWLALAALAIPLYFYTYRVGSEAAPAHMADIEHVLAFAIGVAVEVRWPMRSWPERSWPERVVVGVDGATDLHSRGRLASVLGSRTESRPGGDPAGAG